MEQVLLEVAVPVEVAAQRLAALEQLALRRGPFPAYTPTYTLAYTPSYTLAYTSRYTRGLPPLPAPLGLVEAEARRSAELQHRLHLVRGRGRGRIRVRVRRVLGLS